MSTRAQIIVKDRWEEIWFYRHSDGYPKGTMPTLEKFLEWVKSGKIRDNASQAAGWLVLIGAKEYKTGFEPNTKDKFGGWKCGAYEPCGPKEHGDIEYLYTIDLTTKTISVVDIYERGRG